MKKHNKWHKIYKDPIIGGLTIGQLGSLKYVLNDKMKPVTKGYHNYWMHEGTLIGEVGATNEKVVYL